VTLTPPTSTPEPTETPAPTATPVPTLTPSPSVTLTPTPPPAPKSIRETENILVMGMDMRPGEGAWRTDSMMIVAIDHDANQVGIVSLPRDLWVEIPGYGMGRINQADFLGEYQKYPGGGPALAAKVVEDKLGIPTDHWVRIKMEGLVELVDALDGVTVTLNCPLHELTPHPTLADQYTKFDLPAGEVFLDGATAKKFATYRYASNDFYRARRQQQLIWAIRERVLEADAISKIPELWRTLSKTFKTDLGVIDVIRLARLGVGLGPEQVHGLTFSDKAIQQRIVGGAYVLDITDRGEYEKELAGLFKGSVLSQQGREGSGVCPQPTATPTLTVAVTATVTSAAGPAEPTKAGAGATPTAAVSKSTSPTATPTAEGSKETSPVATP
jgi:LCP family protein required for cell wall assembly